ncbi:hypothetical protein F2Q69_00044105 [Brassica cretica]|uniref:Uncharacterized protein n=1 Tax=Brassica cretica TaxID=69181 RepID=A0A8S9NA06_BRACR|nr:hypothetical protein F2Q69_00044105 [Brassica cretica]
MLGTASLWVGSGTAPRFDDFVLSTLPFMFPHLVTDFIAACVSVTLPFAMFATPGLDSVLLRVCSVDLENYFWSQVWALVSLGLASVLPHSCCSLLPLLPLLVVVLIVRYVCLFLLRGGFGLLLIILPLTCFLGSLHWTLYDKFGSGTAPRFDDFVLSTLPFMFPHLVADFIAACVSLTLPFAMFATPGLDSVLLRVYSVDLEDYFWSQVWAMVSRGLASVLPHSYCSLIPLLPLV